jgi:hypothetical protein
MRLAEQAAPLCYTGAIEYSTDNRDDAKKKEGKVNNNWKERQGPPQAEVARA